VKNVLQRHSARPARPREWYDLGDRTPVHADPHPFAGLDTPEHLGGVIPQIA
jgi:hypothetical protein